MRGTNAKLFRRYAEEATHDNDQRRLRQDLKREWRATTPVDRFDLRKRLRNERYNIMRVDAIRDRVQNDRSIRRLSMTARSPQTKQEEAVRALWFADSAWLSHATFVLDKAGKLQRYVTHPMVKAYEMPLTGLAFDKFWMAAVDDEIPVGHLDSIKKLLMEKTPAGAL